MRCEPQACGPILVVDDDDGFSTYISWLLEAAGFSTRRASTGEEALRAARTERPSLVVLDVCLPVLSGYAVCHELRETYGDEVPILFVSGTRTEAHDRTAGLLLGGDDYLVKPFGGNEFLARVRRLARRTRSPAAASRLTERELQVLQLLASGLGQRDIASHLVISPKTVGTHIEHILEKLDVHSRAQAVAVAYRDGLVDVPA